MLRAARGHVLHCQVSCVVLRHTTRQHVLEGTGGYPRGTQAVLTHHIIRLPSLSSAVSISRLAVKIGTPIEYLPEYLGYPQEYP